MKEVTHNNLPEAVSELQQDVSYIKLLLAEKLNAHSQSNPDEILTIQGAAELLHLSVETVRSYVRKREIPFSRKRKLLYFSRQQLLEWLQQGYQMTKMEANAKLEKASASFIVK